MRIEENAHADLAPADIARQVGFPRPSNFRRATGVTPHAYRTTFRGGVPASG